MAGNDVYLYIVPSDADADDVRLRDPTQAASTGAISVSAAQTLDTLTQSSNVSIPIAVTATQTLATLTQSANVSVPIAVSAAQTLATLTQTATLTVPVSVTAAQTLAALTQSASVSIPVAVSASQTLDALSQSVNVSVPIAVSAAQLLADVSQSVAVGLEVATPVYAPSPSGGGAGLWVRVGEPRIAPVSVRALQSLDDAQSVAIVSVPVAVVVAQTLDNATGITVVEIGPSLADIRAHAALSLLVGVDVLPMRRTAKHVAHDLAALKLLAEAA